MDRALDTRPPAELASDPLHLRFADQIADRFARPDDLLEHDIRSAAYLGLWQAALSYDAHSGASFPTYAHRRIIGAIQDELRVALPRGFRRGSTGPVPYIESLNRPMQENGDGSYAYELLDVIAADGDPVGWEVESEDAVEDLIRDLPWGHKRVMRRLYSECATMKQVGQSVGVTESRVSQVHTQSLAMIQEVLVRRGEND